MLTLSRVSDVAFFPSFHLWLRARRDLPVSVATHCGHCRGWSSARWCENAEISAGVSLWKSRKLLPINSQQWLHFRTVTKQRGIPLGCPGMWGPWVRWGGSAHTNNVLDFKLQLFHTATQKFCLLNQHQVNNYYVPPQSIIHSWFIKYIIVIPRGDKGGVQLSDRGLAQPQIFHSSCWHSWFPCKALLFTLKTEKARAFTPAKLKKKLATLASLP